MAIDNMPNRRDLASRLTGPVVIAKLFSFRASNLALSKETGQKGCPPQADANLMELMNRR
jgi:hypothetical protein